MANHNEQDERQLETMRDYVQSAMESNDGYLSLYNTEQLVFRLIELHGNMHDVGIAPYLKRIDSNPREKAFADQWRKENYPQPGINYGSGILQDLFVEQTTPFQRTYLESITNRDRRIVATVIQWLGTNCGIGFLTESLSKCGYFLKGNVDKSFECLMTKHNEWSNETFPKSTARGAFIHAQREAAEIITDFDNNVPKEQLAVEIMDQMFCLMHGAKKAGITIIELIEAGFNKLEINKGRQWVDNGDGSYSHVKTEKPAP